MPISLNNRSRKHVRTSTQNKLNEPNKYTVQELKYIHNQVFNDGQLISLEKMEYAPSRLYSAAPTVAVQYKLT